MAEGGFDDFELTNKNKEWMSEDEEDAGDEEVTQFFSPDENYGVGDERYGMFSDLDTKKEKEIGVKIPDARRDAKSMRLSMTRGNEKSFEEIFDFPLKKKYGKFSKLLVEDIRFEEFKTRTVIYFKDKRIARYINKILEYLKINRSFLNEFKMVLENAKKEFNNSLESTFYDRVEAVRGDLPPVIENQFREEVLNRSLEKLDENVDKSKEKMRNLQEDNRMIPPPNEMRELNGIFNPKGKDAEEKISFLEIQENIGKEEKHKLVNQK